MAHHLLFRLDGSHRSEVFFDITNTDVIAQDDVDLVNLSVNFQSGGAWSLGFGISNWVMRTMRQCVPAFKPFWHSLR